eukprot:18617_1
MTDSQPTVVWNTEKSEKGTINRDRDGPYYESKVFHIFGCAWTFWLYTNFKKSGNVILRCNLEELPPYLSRISVKFIDRIAETNTQRVSRTFKFDKDYMNWCWAKGVLTANAVKPFKNLTITTKLQLISVYDDGGKLITNQFLNSDDQKMSIPTNSNKLQEYDVRLDSLT